MKFFIVGYMASGKTTFGRELAEENGIPFRDLDSLVEERAGCCIPDIFARKGEGYFRELERDVLREFCARGDDFVLATGGGTVCFFDNMERMNAAGHTLFLDTSLPVIIGRLREQRATRPLLAGLSDEELESHVTKHLDSRLPFYLMAKERL